MDKIIKLIVSGLVSLILVIFLGAFSNPPAELVYISGNGVLLDRGWPAAFRGVAIKESQINFPLVVNPLISEQTSAGWVGDGKQWVSVIHLGYFGTEFGLIWLITFIGIHVVSKKIKMR